MRKEFYYLSRDGKTQIHAMEWIPEGEVRGILQICHGMVEYIGRYDEFAEYMCKRGFYVTGHDHLGHGKSVNSEEDYGYFPEGRGNQYVIGDIQHLRQMTQKKYPNVPYVMLGHSMGSFLLRQYLTMYGGGLSAAVIMGTGYQGSLTLNAGQLACRIIAKSKGWRYRSEFVNNLSLGSYNKKFEPAETTKEWITSDKERRQKYVEDPLCSFVFTLSGYYQMFEGMKVLTNKANIARIPKDLPLLLVSGADDPVGSFGKGVKKVYEQYQKAEIKDVTMKLYEGDRHEILNEKDKDQVYQDIGHWIEKRIGKRR